MPTTLSIEELLQLWSSNRLAWSLLMTLEKLAVLFERAYPGLWETQRLVMALLLTPKLKRELPLAVILKGPPSCGKTTVLIPFLKKREAAVFDLVLRVDDFTSKSFVTHVGGRNPESLSKTDLLPKMKDRVVISKEMAPLFSGKEEDLLQKMATLTTVLDGQGLQTASGNYGMRGYEGSHVFTLVGAVTDDLVAKRFHHVQSTLGPRLIFWDVPTRKISPTKWRGAHNDKVSTLKDEVESNITQIVTERLGWLEDPNNRKVELCPESGEALSAAAMLLSFLRAPQIKPDGEENATVVTREKVGILRPEGFDRVYSHLLQVVTASALLDGKNRVYPRDLFVAVQIALSSGVGSRTKVTKVLLNARQPMIVSEIQKVSGLSNNTVREQLWLLEKCECVRQVQRDSTEQWDLCPPFNLLRLETPTPPQETENSESKSQVSQSDVEGK